MAQQNRSIKSQSSKQPFQRRQHRSLQTAGHAWNRSFLCLNSWERGLFDLIGTGSQSRLSKLKSAQFQRGFRQSMAPHKMRLDSAQSWRPMPVVPRKSNRTSALTATMSVTTPRPEFELGKSFERNWMGRKAIWNKVPVSVRKPRPLPGTSLFFTLKGSQH